MIPFLMCLFLFLPGIPLTLLLWKRRLLDIALLSIAGALGLLWWILLSLFLVVLHLPFSQPVLFICAALPLLLFLFRGLRFSVWKNEHFSCSVHALRLIVALGTTSILVLPFLVVHHQLPTGDIQKAIFWAQEVEKTNGLPHYADAAAFNRDPADFFTPGLHTLTAAVRVFTHDPLSGTAWFSFLLAMLLPGLAVALVGEWTSSSFAALCTWFFAALNDRFLRYVLFPGYHYQNLVGEFLLLFLLLCLATLYGRRVSFQKDRALYVISILTLGALPLVHQFTTFLAALLLPFLAVCLLVSERKKVLAWWQKQSSQFHGWIGGSIVVLLIAGGSAILFSPLGNVLGRFFTLTPHLKSQTILLWEYPSLLGVSLVLFGGIGVVWGLFSPSPAAKLLAFFTLGVLLLGQGSLTVIDIPSARTLFYACAPLALFASLFVHAALTRARSVSPFFAPLVFVLAIAPFVNAAIAQIDSVSHALRTNASLTPDLVATISSFTNTSPKDAVLIDDWNRRRLTWLLLTPERMLTRVGGDMRTIADEMSQSTTRKQLYETQLDFEKIFMIGNDPIIGSLLQKYHITTIGTAKGITDSVFRANPLFRVRSETEDAVLFDKKTDGAPLSSDMETSWLLSRKTLANDVGDTEDTLPHTAISLVSTRLSGPLQEGTKTVRTLYTPDTALRVNVGTYVRPLWDANRDSRIDVPLRLLLRVRSVDTTLSVLLPTGEVHTVVLHARDGMRDITFEIPAMSATLDAQGFLTLPLHTEGDPLSLDLVALGTIQPSS